MALAGLAVAVGWRTQAALGVFLVGFLWMELIDAALYLNHYWLMTLLGALLFVLPVGRSWSIDAASGRVARTSLVPAWMVWAARAQVGVVYVVAGIAKLNGDWLLRGEPLGMWLAARGDRPIVGPLFDLPLTPVVASWAGLVFDLTIVGWLLWRRSRPWAYAAVVVFHLATAALFRIGLFPWAMMALTPVFFEPDWPVRLVGPPVADRGDVSVRPWVRNAVVALAVINVVVPLRHHLYEGDVVENEAGYYGSLRVMLTEKTGTATFLVTDPATGERWAVQPDEVFEPWQVGQLASRRDLLVTAAHVVADEARADGHTDVEVRADTWVSINGRPRQRLVDPTLDLAGLPRRPR
ncbi:MAG: HTTM domain-containing protein [Microthrixaceae bacterium]